MSWVFSVWNFDFQSGSRLDTPNSINLSINQTKSCNFGWNYGILYVAGSGGGSRNPMFLMTDVENHVVQSFEFTLCSSIDNITLIIICLARKKHCQDPIIHIPHPNRAFFSFSIIRRFVGVTWIGTTNSPETHHT